MHNVLNDFLNSLLCLLIIPLILFLLLILLYLLYRLAIFIFPLSKANEEMNISDIFIIKKETFIRDMFQISLMFLIILTPIVVFYSVIDYMNSNTPANCYKPANEIKRSISVLSQALLMGKSIQNIDPKDSSGGIARFFEKHLNIVAGYNYRNSKGKFNPYKSYKRKWYYKDVIGDDLKNLPILFDNRGLMLIILKAKNDCGIKPVLDHNKASCVLLVDINGIRPPNRLMNPENFMSDNPEPIGDRYYIILTNKGVSLEKAMWDKILETP